MQGTDGTWRGWPESRTAIIAEIGINHGGDADLAWEMVLSAHESGADFVKLQSYVTEEFLHPALEYYSTTSTMELSLKTQQELFARSRSEGIELITTIYDVASLDVLDGSEPAAIKIASMDNDNLPLLREVGKLGHPILVACGMLGLDEMQSVVDAVGQTGNQRLVLLHCVSDYPTEPRDLHLSMLQCMKEGLGVPIGLSDHSLGLNSSFMAASMGVCVIEKHFTTDKGLVEKIPAADHDISIDPKELRALREFCEDVPIMKGHAPRELTPGEIQGRTNWKRGIYARRDITVGEELSTENVVFLRPVPAEGLPVSQWDSISGSKASEAIHKHEPITLRDIKQ
jgi:N,N'-diacetyllegionaminate synthase